MLGFIVLLVFVACSCGLLIQVINFFKKFRSNDFAAEQSIQVKYENSMERLVNLYRVDNENLKEQVKGLMEENKSLVHTLDSELFEAEEDDDDESEVVVTMERPLKREKNGVVAIGKQSHFNNPLDQMKLFKKIEAAREVVKHAEFLRQEERVKLIELLTPENDVEAA